MKDRDSDTDSISGVRTESWVGSERLLALTSSVSGSMFSFPSPGEGGASCAEHVLTRSGRLLDGYLWKSTSDSS